MRVGPKQEATFLDGLIEVPDLELEVLEDIIDRQAVGRKLRGIKSDYKAVSRFKIMLLQTRHKLSDVSECC